MMTEYYSILLNLFPYGEYMRCAFSAVSTTKKAIWICCVDSTLSFNGFINKTEIKLFQHENKLRDITPQSRVILEKLTVTQLLKKFPAFMELEGSLPVHKSSTERYWLQIQ
jgi:hypothetical protein